METVISDLINDPNQLISLIIDIGLIAGLFALWLTWYRNGKRQQKLELLLMETAQQLDAATLHLQQATTMIEQLKQREARHQEPAKQVVNEPARAAARKPSATVGDDAEHAMKLPPENSSQATMVLRMHREGEAPEAIADRLDIPLAQVKLLLKLYASKSAA